MNNRWLLLILAVLLFSVISFHMADNSQMWGTVTEGVKNGDDFETIFTRWEMEKHPERFPVPVDSIDSIK